MKKNILLLYIEFVVAFFIEPTFYDRKQPIKTNYTTLDYVEEVPILFVDGGIVK